MSETTLDPALVTKLDAAREASVALAAATTGQKNAALQAISSAVLSGASRIIPANELTLIPDPIGESVRGSSLPNGLKISEVRVPFGVVGAIYEARPNVTIDIAALALKSGNAVVLRGGSAAENSNRVLVRTIQDALRSAGLPVEA